MNKGLYWDLEYACSSIKHGVDVDLDEIRYLLRRAQTAVDLLDTLLDPEKLTVEKQEDNGYVEHRVTTVSVLTRNQLNTILEYMSGATSDE